MRADGSHANARITELLKTRALERYPAESAGPGDIVAIAGFEDITIGETIADPEDVRPLPAITVDDPAISMTIGTNTSPLVGKVKGHKLTARMVKDRLDRELIGNVSLKVVEIGRPDAWEVQGRGELALAILVENMRREGFELTVGKPQVVTKKIDGKTYEPFEHLTIDAPEEYLGAITQLLATRKGRMDNMINHGTGWVRMEFIVPSRGLIGFRTEFLTTTRGTGIANAISHGYEPWAGHIVTRQNGSIVADRSGVVTPFAIIALQERMSFFVQPTQEVYEGMVIGENSRADDMDVNITKEKKLTNMRSSTADNVRVDDPAAGPVARGEPRVRARRRMRRGHAGDGPHPQGHARPDDPRARDLAPEAPGRQRLIGVPAGERPSAQLRDEHRRGAGHERLEHVPGIPGVGQVVAGEQFLRGLGRTDQRASADEDHMFGRARVVRQRSARGTRLRLDDVDVPARPGRTRGDEGGDVRRRGGGHPGMRIRADEGRRVHPLLHEGGERQPQRVGDRPQRLDARAGGSALQLRHRGLRHPGTTRQLRNRDPGGLAFSAEGSGDARTEIVHAASIPNDRSS